MKFDRFLALLFSKRSIALILLILAAVSCLGACQLTLEDVLCLAFCGCLTPETCSKLLWACDCEANSGGESEEAGCDTSCVGDCYNSGFDCVWENFLKDCRPSEICSSCEGSGEEEDPSDCPSCDEYFLICTDAFLYS